MVESLVLKEDQAEAFPIVSITYRKHNSTAPLHISTVFNCYGPLREHFGGELVDAPTKNSISQWLKA
jgi:hypothetical protein